MAEDTARLKETTGVVPGLAIVQVLRLVLRPVQQVPVLMNHSDCSFQVGDRSDSSVYIRMKTKTAAEVGIAARHVKLSSDVTEDDVSFFLPEFPVPSSSNSNTLYLCVQLLDKIEELNRDSSIHGIIVQLPLDCGNLIDVSKATDTILPTKDVDG